MVMLCVLGLLSGLLPYLSRAQHPLSLSGLVFLVSLCVSSMLGIFISSYYAYVLFLVYAGALLIVFTFSTALASNPKFEMESGWWGIIPAVLVVGLCLFFWDCLFFFKWHSNLSVDVSGDPLHDGVRIIGSVGGLHGIVGMGFVMFVVMVSCAKLCARQDGPLRGNL
uniref:NADH dehydrogenase subunit 6 n=1 Tax=Bryopa lata TaxID=1969317 RepID=A0A1U9XPD9_9BIVA|nr:NADH dehydrogenase subunit 6 [Bryopa lata]AQZ26114.1 NADH dehydrogenase subunit 6 [Bryopa lata]